jgi:hypothetical protein
VIASGVPCDRISAIVNSPLIVWKGLGLILVFEVSLPCLKHATCRVRQPGAVVRSAEQAGHLQARQQVTFAVTLRAKGMTLEVGFHIKDISSARSLCAMS